MKNEYSADLRFANGCSDDFTFVPEQEDIPVSEYAGLIMVGCLALSMQLLVCISICIAYVLYVKQGGAICDFDFLNNDVVIYDYGRNGTIAYEVAKN